MSSISIGGYTLEDAGNGKLTVTEDSTGESVELDGSTLSSVSQFDVETIAANQFNNIEMITDDMSESSVRDTISNGSANSAFIIEPGASWTLTDTLVQPAGSNIIGFNPGLFAAPTFKKGFDGTMMKVRNNSYLQGITLDGNKGSHTGNGIAFEEDPVTDTISGGSWFEVTIIDNEGDACVFESPVYSWEFRECRFHGSGGWGLRLKDAGTHHTRNIWLNSVMDDNDAGGVKYEMESRYSRMYAEIGRNGGPAVQADGGALHNFDLQGNLIENDGPALLLDGDVWGSININAQISGNAANPSGLTGPVGQIHAEGLQTNTDVVIYNCNHSDSGNSDNSFISNRTSNKLNVAILGGRNNAGTTQSIDGSDIYMNVLTQGNWNGIEYNCSGMLFNQRNESVRRLGDSQMYLGFNYGPPNTSSESNLVYFDGGTATGDGNPGWRYSFDGGSSWSDVN